MNEQMDEAAPYDAYDHRKTPSDDLEKGVLAYLQACADLERRRLDCVEADRLFLEAEERVVKADRAIVAEISKDDEVRHLIVGDKLAITHPKKNGSGACIEIKSVQAHLKPA